MKTKLLITALCYLLFQGNLKAQSMFNSYGFYLHENTFGKPIKYSASNHGAKVKDFEVVYRKESGKINRRNVYRLNANGYMIYSAVYNSHNKLKQENVATFSDDTTLTSRLIKNGKGDTISYTVYTFNNNKLVRSFSKRGNKTQETLYTYNNLGKTTQMVSNRNGKQKYAITYEYDDNGKLIKQSTYNKKNILVSVTNYECNYQGESQKKVDQSKVCTRQDKLPNGGYVVYNDYTNPKGKLIRSVSTYTSDSNLVKREEFNSKNVLIGTTQYEYNAQGYCTKYAHQYKKNTYYYTVSLNEFNLIKETVWGNNNHISGKAIYSYNFFQ